MKIKHLLFSMFTVASFVACSPDEEDITVAALLEIDKTSFSVSAEGESVKVIVKSNVDWTASFDQDWISVNPASGKESDETVVMNITVEPNAFNEARSAVITVSSATLTRIVNVNQAGVEHVEFVPLSPDDQKEKLEEVAEHFIDKYPSSEFDEFFKLADRFSETYLENVSDQYWDSFFKFCEERGEEMFFYEDEEVEKNGEIHRSWNMEAFLEFSQIHGLLTLGATSATCVDYDGTKMVFSLGKDNYVVEIKASGMTTTAIYTYEDIYGYERYDGYYDDWTGYWVDDYVMVHGKDRWHFEVEVPERIDIVITKNEKNFASASMIFENRFSESGVDVTLDCFKMTLSVNIDEHSVILDKTGYDATTGKATVSYMLKKGDESIVKTEFSGDVKMEIITEHEEYGEKDYGTYTHVEFNLAKNFEVYVDVLGELQVMGICTDALSIAENVENFWDANNDTQAERAVDNMNNYFDLGIYYDSDNFVNRQADVVMDYYVEKDDYYGDTWYEFEPILLFPDGSKYAFYEYFDEDSFTGLESSFELWMEMYETMFEHYFE